MNKPIGAFVRIFVLFAARVASSSMVADRSIHTVAELQRQIHDDLRAQHPEWIEPSGESPMCDFYEARLGQLLAAHAWSSPSKAA